MSMMALESIKGPDTQLFEMALLTLSTIIEQWWDYFPGWRTEGYPGGGGVEEEPEPHRKKMA